MVTSLDAFRQIWCVDFEYFAGPGERPIPVCVVAREFRTGETIRLWQDELLGRKEPPYPVGKDVLFVAYYASAEIGCHLVLGWPLPVHILDLYTEFRNHFNGYAMPHGFGLLGLMYACGLDAMSVAEKEEMRKLPEKGEGRGPWTGDERKALLDYCQSDADALLKALPVMLPWLDLPRAIAIRGRFMAAAALMEHAGVPLDVRTLGRLRGRWDVIKDSLIADVDHDFGVYEGRTFKADRWAAWLAREGIPWPTLESGELELTDGTFKEMARVDPRVSLMRELRNSLSKLRLNTLAVGRDGRNRTLLSPFRARSSRNAPSNAKYIFGPSTWVRSLIKPGPGRAVAYVDYCQQEFAIGAALSGDAMMMKAYESGDPYLEFGRQAGMIPADGTKETHGRERDLFKTCALGVQYGMEAWSLSRRIDRPPAYAQELLNLHHKTYRDFWRWSDGARDVAMLNGSISTVFGWILHVHSDTKVRSIRNFPCQGNGAEMLRLACMIAAERGLPIVAPIHDAVMVEASTADIFDVVQQTRRAMTEAAEIILDGFPLRTEAKVIRYPRRYVDERGKDFWGRTMSLAR
jgi:hypothetical protein